MKKRYIIFWILLGLNFFVLFFYFNKQEMNFNSSYIKSLSDFKSNIDMGKHPFLKSIYKERQNYKKNVYQMYPKLAGIDYQSINESWSFIYAGKKFYAFQGNEITCVNKKDDFDVKTHYYLSIYNPNKKLVTEIVNNKGKYESSMHLIFRKGHTLDSTFFAVDSKTGKLKKKNHKVLTIPDCEYISGISDYLTIFPYNKVIGLKNKFYCIYSEDELKLNRYSYNILNKKAKTKNEPWTIEFQEIQENSINTVKSKAFFDSEKNVIYKTSYGPISSVLVGKDAVRVDRHADRRTAEASVPLNFWLINKNNLEELKLKIVFNSHDSEILVKKIPRQTVQKISGNTLVLTLKPENLAATSYEKITQMEVSNSLQSTIKYPSDDEKIKKLAKIITGEAKSNLEKSQKIMSWINSNIKWTYDSNTDVLDTLKTKKGDCTERSDLFITLARASGVPADFSGGYLIDIDSLGGHAWAKIYLNNRWVEVDPSNNKLVDAAYLTSEMPLMPRDIKSVQVVDVKYKNIKAETISRKTPFIIHGKTFYSNRILGVSFTLPEYLKMSVPKKISGELFRVSFRPSVLKLSDYINHFSIMNTKIFILVSDYDTKLFTESKFAKNARIEGVEIKSRRVLSDGGYTVLFEKFTIPSKDVEGLCYSYPIKNKMIITFLAIGESEYIDTLFSSKHIPQVFLDILTGLKTFNPSF